MVRWLMCEVAGLLLQGFEELAEECGISLQALRNATAADADPSAYRRALAREVYGKLATQEKHTLLVMDNADDAELLSDFLEGRPDNTQVVITTRDAKMFEGTYPRVPVGVFSKEQGLQYLRDRFADM